MKPTSSFLVSMRSNLLALFAGCVVAVFVTAQSFTPTDAAWVGQLGAAEEAGCATTDTTLPHDTLLEGFGTPGYEQAWTEVGTTANINDAADSSALAKNKPDGACDTAWYLNVPTDGTETYAYWNYGSEIDTATSEVDMYVYLWIVNGPSAAGENFAIYGALAGDNVNLVFKLMLENSAGTLRVFVSSSANSATVNVSTGSWYKLHIHSDTTAASSYMSVNDGDHKTFTRYDRDIQYIRIGAPYNLDADDNGDLYIDLVCVDTP